MKKLLVLLSLLSLSGYACAMEQAKTISRANADAWQAVVAGDGDAAKFAECQKRSDFDINCRYPGAQNKTLLSYLCMMLCTPARTLERVKILSAILSSHGKNSGKPVDANCIDDNKFSALHYALNSDDPTVLRLLLAHQEHIGLDSNVHNDIKDQWTALNWAIDNKARQHAHLLMLMSNVDPNIPNKWKAYPLHSALRAPYHARDLNSSSDIDTIRDLAEIGAKTNVRNQGWQSPLELCCNKIARGTLPPDRAIALLAIGASVYDNGVWNVIEDILRAGPWQNPFSSQNEIPECDAFLKASFRAAIQAATDISVEIDITKKIIVNAHDRIFGMTGLMWAAARGNLQLAKKILELGANPLLIDKHGDTALHHAVRNGHVEVVRYLQKLEPLALTMKNVNKRTPVDVAISSKQSREMLLALGE